MNLRRLLLLAALLLTTSALADKLAVTVVAHGPLLNLDGQTAGQVRIERQAGRRYLHVVGAGGAAGANLKLLLSESSRPLLPGDHSGPGPNALNLGLIAGPEVRYALPPRLNLISLHTVWVWCGSVRLASARALLVNTTSR